MCTYVCIIWRDVSLRSKKTNRQSKKHGLDYNDASTVIESGHTVTFEDRRFDYGEERFITLGLLNDDVVVIVTSETEDEIRIISMQRPLDMNKRSSTITSRYSPPLRQADIDSGKVVLRTRNAGGQIQPLKQRINIYLDAAIVAHFKKKAGTRGYQTLINEELKQSIQQQSLERMVRKVVRDELKKRAA